jgi:lipoyl(octanoyl) transferase
MGSIQRTIPIDNFDSYHSHMQHAGNSYESPFKINVRYQSTSEVQTRSLLAFPIIPIDPPTAHSDKEHPGHDLDSESHAAEGYLVSYVDGSHLGHDVPWQGSTSLRTPPPRAGTLIRFSHPIPYAESWTLQKQLQEGRIAERQEDVLLLLEHQPVYTLGRTTQPAHWSCGEEILLRTGASLQFVDRGGSITYHGPGQVVGYPILKLSHYCSGPKQYVWKLEEVLIHTLLRWGIEGYRIEKHPGVWVRWNHADAKIASIGVRIDHGVTIHGFSLNVDLDLSPFSLIMPCGLAQCPITSMTAVRQSSLSSTAVAQQVTEEFARIFNIQWMNFSLDIMAQEHRDHQPRADEPVSP